MKPYTKHFPHKSLAGIIHFDQKKTTIETKEGETYYVYETRTQGFLHGDFVSFEITRKGEDGKLPEARPVKLLRRSEEALLMELVLEKGKLKYKILDEFGGITVKLEKMLESPKVGDLYLVQFNKENTVRLIRKFGARSDKTVEEMVILFRNGVRLEWPKEFAHLQVKTFGSIPTAKPSAHKNPLQFEGVLPSNIKLSDRILFSRIKLEGKERMDFREWPTLTIDGEDAKDLDDAISLARYENGDFLLGVHIADVAEYVEEGSALDREALLRGTSIYTPGRVLPMLPEILSNDRCSLHPGEPKLVLSILLRVDPNGKIRESYITEGVIDSMHRGVYDEVYGLKVSEIGKTTLNQATNKIENPKLKTENSPPLWHTIIEHAWMLYDILSKRRKQEGKITFETTECYFDIDDERSVLGIKKRDRNDAHMLIEECMVLANEEVAKWCAKQKLPFLSRVHAAPGTEQMKLIAEIIEQKHLFDSIEPHHIREYLEMAKDPVERYRLSRLLLPKMAKAHYGDLPVRHFGLALTYYSHFTSPIRRYPDLLVHRIIKKFLHNDLDPKTKAQYMKEMKKYGKSLTEREKRAEDVERAIDALMMCRYMSKFVGQEYEGIISGVTENAIYVELRNGVEGSIFFGRQKKHMSKQPIEKLTLDPIRGSLRDRKGKELYRIGNSLQVKIDEVDMLNRRIEMSELL